GLGARRLRSCPFGCGPYVRARNATQLACLRIAEHKIVAALNLARQDRIDSLEGGLDSLDLDLIALLEYEVVTLHHLGGRNVNLVHLALSLEHQVSAHGVANGALAVLHLVNDAFDLDLSREVILWNCFLLTSVLRDDAGRHARGQRDSERSVARFLSFVLLPVGTNPRAWLLEEL